LKVEARSAENFSQEPEGRLDGFAFTVELPGWIGSKLDYFAFYKRSLNARASLCSPNAIIDGRSLFLELKNQLINCDSTAQSCLTQKKSNECL